MRIEELREIFSEDGLYTVRVEKGAIVSHCRIKCLQSQQRKSEPPRESWRVFYL
ncbi:putative prophage protein [Escherichia coli]|nr:putative prophage protein [Escherichia coli]